jgi:hypothetical protein
MNDLYHSLPDFPYSTARRTEDMLRDVFTDSLIYRIEATVTVAAGVAGVVRGTGSVAQLLNRTDLNWDGTELFTINGAELRKVTGANSARAIRETVLASAAAGSYDISGDYMVPFARRDLVDPMQTILPPFPVRQQFRLGVEWNVERTNATSTQGSAALITGGTSVVTLTNVRVQVVQSYSTRGQTPRFIPILTGIDSEQFLAANARLRIPLRGTRKFNAVLLHSFNAGDTFNDADLVNYVTFKSGNDTLMDNLDRDVLRSAVLYKYPGMPADAGWIYIPMAAGGRLENIVDPVALSTPAFELDVAAPASNPGTVRMLFFELVTVDGVTA